MTEEVVKFHVTPDKESNMTDQHTIQPSTSSDGDNQGSNKKGYSKHKKDSSDDDSVKIAVSRKQLERWRKALEEEVHSPDGERRRS